MIRAPKRNRNSVTCRNRSLQIFAFVLFVGFGLLLVQRRPVNGGRPIGPRVVTVKAEITPKTSSPTPPPSTFPSVNFSSPECRKFTSQHGEDKELFIQYWVSPSPKTDGVFLELGALDGVDFSNSYWYEMCLGWTGVLIEGHPTAAAALKKNRPNSINFEAAACERDEGNVTFVGTANGVSGDISKMPDSFIRDQHPWYLRGHEESHVVQCRTISSMLEEAKVDHIDFWTLDVEGAEFTVLTTFDWERVAVHVLVIENDKDESVEFNRRHDFLKSKGMNYFGPLYNNELWVNPNYPDIIFPSNEEKMTNAF